MNGKTVQMFSSHLSAMHILTTVTQIFKSFMAIGKIPGGSLALKWKKNPQCQENVAQSAFKTTIVKYLKVFLYLCRAFYSLSLNLEVLDCLALIVSSLLSCTLVTLPVDQKFHCFIPRCLSIQFFFKLVTLLNSI